MLPSAVTKLNITKSAVAGITALAIAVAASAPAQALGRDERNILKGVAATLLVDAMLDEMRKTRKAQTPTYNFVQPQPVYRPAQVYQPQPVYQPAPTYTTSIYRTAAAQAFNAYTYTDRKRIQSHLAAQGYYRSGIDGAFGPGTYNALISYAQARGNASALNTQAGAFGVMDGLLY